MISIIIPVHNEGPNIRPLFNEIAAVCSAGGNWEILWVNDGSTDKTEEEVLALQPRGGVCVYLKMRRHFGQSAALACGLEHARGEIVVTIDGDRQNDPADIPALIEKLGDDADVVCGWRQSRQDDWLRSVISRAANRLIGAIAHVELHDSGCTLRAYKRKALEKLPIMGEMHRLLPAYLVWSGARLVEIPVRHRRRVAGRSNYALIPRIWKVVLDAILLEFYFSYMTRPMHLFGSAAAGLFLAAGGLETFVIFRKLILGGEWISPLFFLGLFLACSSLFFLFLGVLADLTVRNFMATSTVKTYHVEKKTVLGNVE
ncbi:MAG: glycosyltransferase family 2 protein [Elusimicrobia bacterium]|nr:glycosyltransferase family 2 protein [Elusimicrobiota bacterium]